MTALAERLATYSDRCEEWRSLAPRFPMYEVSNLGRVRSWRPYNRLTLPYLMTPTLALNGYYCVKLIDASGKNCNPTLHSLVAHGFLGPRPAGAVIRHLDGTPTNNDPANLKYGTVTENLDDSVRHGTHPEARKTECDQGHPYTPENTRMEARPGGRWARRCLTCQREYSRRYYRRKRAAQ